MSSHIKGLGIGKRELVATINLTVPPNLNLAHGVYAARVTLDIEHVPQQFIAAMHFGPRPAIGREEITFELHLLDVTPPLPVYDPTHITVEPVQFIRHTQAFANPQLLKAQIIQDIAQIRQVFDTLTGTHETKTDRMH